MNNFQLYGCVPRFDNQDQCVVYQMSTNKITDYFEEANEVQNCPFVRQITFKYIENVKKEILFRVKYKQIIPYYKFLMIKPLNILEFEILLITLIETFYYINKKNIYLNKQCRLYVQIDSDSKTQQDPRRIPVQELRMMIDGIQQNVQATKNLLKIHSQEIQQFINEFDNCLENLMHQLYDININISLIPKILETFEQNQKNDYINFIKSELFKISDIFNEITYEEEFKVLQLEEQKIQEEEKTQEEKLKKVDQQKIMANPEIDLLDSKTINKFNKNQSENKLSNNDPEQFNPSENKPSAEKETKQKVNRETNYVQLLNNIFGKLNSQNQDYLNKAIQSIVSFYSRERQHYIYSKQKEILTPIEYELNILPQILSNYGLYLKSEKPQIQEQDYQQQIFKKNQISQLKSIQEVVSKTYFQNQLTQIIDLDFDHFQIFIMDITKKQDKIYQNQIDMIKLMIKSFIQTNKNQQKETSFKEIIELSKILENKSDLDMKFLLEQQYIRNLLIKKRLKEEFEKQEVLSYVKQDYFKIQNQLQKQFYEEMLNYYKIKLAVPTDNQIKFYPKKLPEIRSLQIRIHVLKEFKGNIKILFDNSTKSKLNEAKNIFNVFLLVNYQLIQLQMGKLQNMEYQQLQALQNQEEFKNFQKEIQTKINKLQQNLNLTGIHQNILQKYGYNSSLLNFTFGELIQSPEIINKFNLLLNYYRSRYNQIQRTDPTKENIYRYNLYRSLKFLKTQEMPYSLSILELDLPYYCDYEEYYLTIRNGRIQEIKELITDNQSKHMERNKQKKLTFY